MKKYDINRITNHYFKVLRAVRNGTITVSDLNELLTIDLNNFNQLLENREINQQEFDSYLIVLNEFEDLFEETINGKKMEDGKWKMENRMEDENNISILIPAYNAQDTIVMTIESLYGQNYNEFIVGVDGCKKTLKTLLKYKDKYPKLKIYYCKENKGAYVMRNTLIEISNKNNDVLFFDADDIAFKYLISSIQECDAPIRMFKYFYLDNNIIKKTNLGNAYYAWANGSIFVKRNVFDKLGGYESWRFSADTEFLTRAKISNFPIHKIDKELFAYRQHEQSLCKLISTADRINKNNYINLLDSKCEMYVTPERNYGKFK